MFTLTLASTLAASLHELCEIITNVFSRGDTLAHPKDLVPALQKLPMVWGVIFVVAGLLCMLNGYRYYKAVVVGLALAIGIFGGYALGNHVGAPFIVAGCLGALLATSSWPLMKYAVAIVGGMIGAFIGSNLWTSVTMFFEKPDEVVNNYWIGALMGLIICGMLAFIMFRLSVVVFTSVAGATIAVMGIMALLLRVDAWEDTITSSISAHAVIMPMLVFVPAIIALILQECKPDDASGHPA